VKQSEETQTEGLFSVDGETKVHVSDQVIKLYEECKLLGRFLIVQGSQPSLVPKLEETIGKYETSVVLRSLCAVDGSLYIPTNTSSRMHAVEDARADSIEVVPQPDLVQEEDSSVSVLILDAVVVLQSMRKTPAML